MATILAVDDRAINREFLSTLLAYGGHEVLQAADGAEALELVRSKRPDLVITDVLMPTMDGVEFADRVHRDPEIAHIPIIFYTATYRLPEARTLATSCNVAGVLAKPAEPQVILDAVGAALGATAAPVAQVPGISLAESHHGARGPTLPAYLRKLTHSRERLRRAADRADRSAGGGEQAQRSLHSLSLRLATLLEFDLTLGSERDPQKMADLLCSAAQDILNCKYAVVAVLDNAGDRIRYRAMRGFDAAVEAQFAALEPMSGIFGEIIATGNTYVAENPDGLPPPPGVPELVPPPTSMMIVPVPVRSATSVCGWLLLADKLGGGPFETEDEQFAISLVTQFTLTFGNLILYDEIQQHAVKLQMEVSERRRAQEELAYRMSHDQTTGLPRFELIEHFLRTAFVEASATGGRVMVYYVDLDRFSVINETHGRNVGDEVLRTVANRLRAIIGGDQQLAHIAADEFAFAVADPSDKVDQVEFGEVARRCIEEPIVIEGGHVYATCSVGVSCFPDNGVTPQELLLQAEAAMLLAKNEGRNAVSAFANEQRQALEERKSLGLRLRDAIQNNQFLLHYQPQISGQDWEIHGFEVLLRWQSPEFGLLQPSRFLGVAEDLGMMVDIGALVLEATCRQAREWLDAGAEDFSLQVNVSTLQLQRPDFAGEVQAVLERWRVPARHLALELTENMMAGNIQRVQSAMQSLKRLGIQIALDDFGTGYSSLNYLRKLPIDTLKIDQSFVQDISSDSGAAGICRAIITLGHQLGMTVLAEGVETAAQVGYLRRNDCDSFQGFFFSKPVSAAQAFSMLGHRYMASESLLARQDTRTLLLVDDEENVLSALNRTLRRDGYRILTASNASDALEILAQNDVEVILSDQRMPGESGTEFLGKVKEMYPHTVRIMLSGYTDLSAVTEAINRGAIYKFLIKPWNDEELRAQIREAFRMHQRNRSENPQPTHEEDS